MENEVICEYICDRNACINCRANPDCDRTRDIRHAVNFESMSIGTRTFFIEKSEHVFVPFFDKLSDGAKELIAKNPEFINELCKKYEKLLDDSANDMIDRMI